MQEQNWRSIESHYVSAIDALNELSDTIDTINTSAAEYDKLRTCQRSVRHELKRIYNNCEDDHEAEPEYDMTGYEELYEELPDATKLSLGDMTDLLEAVRNWRTSHGL